MFVLLALAFSSVQKYGEGCPSCGSSFTALFNVLSQYAQNGECDKDFFENPTVCGALTMYLSSPAQDCYPTCLLNTAECNLAQQVISTCSNVPDTVCSGAITATQLRNITTPCETFSAFCSNEYMELAQVPVAECPPPQWDPTNALCIALQPSFQYLESNCEGISLMDTNFCTTGKKLATVSELYQCAMAQRYICGNDMYPLLDPNFVCKACYDHNALVASISEAVGASEVGSCAAVKKDGLCNHHNPISPLAKLFCPETCGVMDQDHEVAAYARSMGHPEWTSCVNLVSDNRASCYDMSIGPTLRRLCPCSCNYQMISAIGASPLV